MYEYSMKYSTRMYSYSFSISVSSHTVHCIQNLTYDYVCKLWICSCQWSNLQHSYTTNKKYNLKCLRRVRQTTRTKQPQCCNLTFCYSVLPRVVCYSLRIAFALSARPVCASASLFIIIHIIIFIIHSSFVSALRRAARPARQCATPRHY